MTGYPDNNPKTILGVSKVPLHLVPPSCKHALAEAFADGANKYGPYNWREKTVSASIYVAALQRHMDAWWDGEDVASDSGVAHLSHAMACIAIIVDAMSVGKLNDDRPLRGAAPELQAAYAALKKGVTTKDDQTTNHTASPATTKHDPVVVSGLANV